MKIQLDLSGGYKIRIHRVVLELLIFGFVAFYYGWLALLLLILVVVLELFPFGKLDAKINPWYRKYIIQRQEKEMADHFSGDDPDDDNDGLDDNCPRCHREYDEIDREYQVCHLCGHVNNPDF